MTSIEEIATFAKRKGFVFPSCEIYGGIAGFFDYGPLGVEMKKNIKDLWWKAIVQDREDVVGVDGSIITSEKVWDASGHLENFVDVLVKCVKCKKTVRLDHMIEEQLKITTDEMSAEQMMDLMEKHKIRCNKCKGDFDKASEFNLMFKTSIGSHGEYTGYLRPETAQLIFVNFKNILETSRQKIPFGIAQIGKAFRNEISPRNFLFRMREFEQMEMQYFVREKNAAKFFKQWQKARMDWYVSLGIDKKRLRFREHSKEELAHYAKKAIDVEYKFDFGWKEIEGIHNRADWDLSQHEKFSKQDLKYFDEPTKKKFIPWVIEVSAGLDRIFLTVLINAYTEEKVKKEKRIVLKLDPKIAPYKVAIFPLVKKDKLPEVAKKIFDKLKTKFNVFYDESGSVGRRYRRMDEIGTPFCITVDHDTLKDKSVTVRDRDTMKQDRIKIKDLEKYFEKKL